MRYLVFYNINFFFLNTKLQYEICYALSCSALSYMILFINNGHIITIGDMLYSVLSNVI